MLNNLRPHILVKINQRLLKDYGVLRAKESPKEVKTVYAPCSFVGIGLDLHLKDTLQMKMHQL